MRIADECKNCCLLVETRKGHMCRALYKRIEPCSFFKTKQQYDKEIKMCEKRIESLPLKDRNHIYKKYYGVAEISVDEE